MKKTYTVYVGNKNQLVCSISVVAYNEEQACNQVAMWLEENRPKWNVDSFKAVENKK